MHHRNVVAAVTGGGSGIGLASVSVLAARGMKVAVIDRQPDEGVAIATSMGVDAHGYTVDVANETEVESCFAAIGRDLGPTSVLVHAAGILRDQLLFRMSTSEWDDVISVHLRGAFLVARAAQRTMVQQQWGRIVTLSSTSARGHRGQANYAAAKAGIEALTKTMAIELGPMGVTANAIAPGFIATDMTRRTAERMGIDFSEYQKMAAAAIPVRRVGQAEDVAELVAFLVSDEAGYINGEVLHVAGGPVS